MPEAAIVDLHPQRYPRERACLDLRRWHREAKRRPGIRRLADRWGWTVGETRTLVQSPGDWLDEPGLVALQLAEAQAELERVRLEQVETLRFNDRVVEGLRAEIRDLRARVDELEARVADSVTHGQALVIVDEALEQRLAAGEAATEREAKLQAEVDTLRAELADQRATIAELAVYIRRLTAAPTAPEPPAPPAKPEPRNAWEAWWVEEVEQRVEALRWRYDRADALSWFAKLRTRLGREHRVTGEQVRAAVLALLDRAESGHAAVVNWKNAVRQYAIKQAAFAAEREAASPTPSPKQQAHDALRELWTLLVNVGRQERWLRSAEASGRLVLTDAHRRAFAAWGGPSRARSTMQDGERAIEREFWAFRKEYISALAAQ